MAYGDSPPPAVPLRVFRSRTVEAHAERGAPVTPPSAFTDRLRRSPRALFPRERAASSSATFCADPRIASRGSTTGGTMGGATSYRSAVYWLLRIRRPKLHSAPAVTAASAEARSWRRHPEVGK